MPANIYLTAAHNHTKGGEGGLRREGAGDAKLEWWPSLRASLCESLSRGLF